MFAFWNSSLAAGAITFILSLTEVWRMSSWNICVGIKFLLHHIVLLSPTVSTIPLAVSMSLAHIMPATTVPCITTSFIWKGSVFPTGVTVSTTITSCWLTDMI